LAAAPEEVGEALVRRLEEGATYQAARCIAVTLARRRQEGAAPALLRWLDRAGGLIGSHRIVLDALALLGEGTVEALRDLYFKSELRTPGLVATAAAMAGGPGAAELLGEMRRLEDVSAPVQAALLAHMGAPDGLERIGRDLREDNAETLLPALELLAELHGAAPGLAQQARRLAWQAGRRGAAQRSVGKVGRNDPCPCGSGRKHKHCCLRKEP
jgi:hypothetical protein